MKVQHVLFIVGLMLPALGAKAQEDPEFEAYRRQSESEYKTFSDKEKSDFAAFRAKANAEYAAFVEQSWQEMQAMAAIPVPESSKPKTPPLNRSVVQPLGPAPLSFSDVVPLPAEPKPIDVPDIELTLEAESDAMEEVDFFATKIVVRIARKVVLAKLASLAEKEVARVWRYFSRGTHDGLLKSCMEQRRRYDLCDWAYFQLCGSAAEKVFGRQCNEAVLLQSFLLTQSGYRIRMAENSGNLVLLAPFDHTVYNYPYLNIDGMKYYVLGKAKSTTYRVCKAVFPRERTASICIRRLPSLSVESTKPRTFVGGRYPNMKATMTVNRNLMAFYSRYPVSSAWDAYAHTSLSKETKSSLYPALRSQLEGLSERKQVDMLLDFVQNAFEYKIDQDQFGYERPLFGDESFYYPFNDCEDRSILFAILVHDLVGLDVVLVHWPGHLATAVAFSEEVDGDYFTLKEKHYTVCDPTYIGASPGETMPQFQAVPAKLVSL